MPADNFPLDSTHGWNVFIEGTRYPLERRPAHISMASTREELAIYLRNAGFEDVRVHDLPNELIAATGRKPAKGRAAYRRWYSAIRTFALSMGSPGIPGTAWESKARASTKRMRRDTVPR